MNETEDIYEMKTINDLYEKLVISVTGQNDPPLKAAGASRQKLWLFKMATLVELLDRL